MCLPEEDGRSMLSLGSSKVSSSSYLNTLGSFSLSLSLLACSFGGLHSADNTFFIQSYTNKLVKTQAIYHSGVPQISFVTWEVQKIEQSVKVEKWRRLKGFFGNRKFLLVIDYYGYISGENEACSTTMWQTVKIPVVYVFCIYVHYIFSM